MVVFCLLENKNNIVPQPVCILLCNLCYFHSEYLTASLFISCLFFVFVFSVAFLLFVVVTAAAAAAAAFLFVSSSFFFFAFVYIIVIS